MHEIMTIGSMYLWRAGRGVYRFSPEVYDALIHQPLSGDLPIECLYHLPEWAVYIETPGLLFGSWPIPVPWPHVSVPALLFPFCVPPFLENSREFPGILWTHYLTSFRNNARCGLLTAYGLTKITEAVYRDGGACADKAAYGFLDEIRELAGMCR